MPTIKSLTAAWTPDDAVETAPGCSNACHSLARSKALEQLCVSDDSPFRFQMQQRGATSEEALPAVDVNEDARASKYLQFEAENIKRSLEQVRDRLAQLKMVASDDAVQEQESPPSQQRRPSSLRQARTINLTRQTSSDTRHNPQRFRPLTGQRDCPNCSCDRERRVSICDACASIQTTPRKPLHSLPIDLAEGKVAETQAQEAQNFSNDKENASRQDTADTARASKEPERVERISDVCVPGKVFTISKSLDQKRTRLAQAIEDLRLSIEQVRERSDRLEQERKLVQLYKDQWRFGPSVGNSGGRPRAAAGAPTGSGPIVRYESRLDPRLRNDMNSIMGFQGVASVVSKRVPYAPRASFAKSNPALNNNNKQHASPERKYSSIGSRLAASSTLASSAKRSQSLESLKLVGTRAVYKETSSRGLANFQRGKSSSDMSIDSRCGETSAKSADTRGDEEHEVEEQVETELVVESSDDSAEQNKQQLDRPQNPDDRPISGVNASLAEPADEAKPRAGRMTWIPVFGETEIKSVKRAPTRKLARVTTAPKRPQQVSVPPKQAPPLRSSLRSSSTTSNSGQQEHRVIGEAKRKLKFATDLLAEEKRDSSPKLAVISSARPRSIDKSNNNQAGARKRAVSDNNLSVHDEIKRLEDKLVEQQSLLARLTETDSIGRSCSPSCCHHHHIHLDAAGSPAHSWTSSASSSGTSTAAKRAGRASTTTTTSSSAIIHQLRDKLNKTRHRLARRLEEERERHARLQSTVDSSLRKQEQLARENELLKSSLNECIDTCLRDISRTFESLSDTLQTTTIHLAAAEQRQQLSGDTNQSKSVSNLMTENKLLQQLRSDLEAIEKQRRDIFEQLEREKQRSALLEAQLREAPAMQTGDDSAANRADDSKASDDAPEESSSYNSVELYRRFIQSISPDLQSLRQQREDILGEFDNMKKLLATNTSAIL